MIMKVLAYKDTKLNIFTQPFYLDGSLQREDLIETIRRMCAAPGVPAVFFEYDAYVLGEYDDKLGIFQNCSPEFLVSLGDFKHLRFVEEPKEEVQNVQG